MLMRVVIEPEEIVLKRERLIGPLLSNSVVSSLFEISSMAFGLVNPPRKNSNTLVLFYKFGFQVFVSMR